MGAFAKAGKSNTRENRYLDCEFVGQPSHKIFINNINLLVYLSRNRIAIFC